MIAIMKLKMDYRGRVTLPDNFLKANGIKQGSYIHVFPVSNRDDSIRLQFKLENSNEKDK